MADPPTTIDVTDILTYEEAVALVLASSDSLCRYVAEQDDHPYAQQLAQAVSVSLRLMQRTESSHP